MLDDNNKQQTPPPLQTPTKARGGSEPSSASEAKPKRRLQTPTSSWLGSAAGIERPGFKGLGAPVVAYDGRRPL